MNFLSLEKEIFGLDISDRSLKMIKLKKKGGVFKVVSLEQMELEKGIVEGGIVIEEETLSKIIKNLYARAKNLNANTKYVVASLPEERSFLQVIQMPKMNEEELRSAVPFEAENYIPLPMSEVYLDYQPITPIKDHLNHLDVLIVATPKKIVNSYVSCIKKAGLIPYALEVESQAIVRALIEHETSQHPVIIVDFGKTSTIFIIFAGRSIQFTCSIPVSSHQLTQAIAKLMDVKDHEAEKIKVKHNLSELKPTVRSKGITRAIEPVLENLVAQIKKYLNFYQDHASHEHLAAPEKIKKILLCGGGSSLQGLPQYLAHKLDMEVELGSFSINLVPAKTKKDAHQHPYPLSLATALGLALREIKPK